MTEEIKNTDNMNTEEHNGEVHEYDGIKELNNPAPFWIMLLFIATIGFSLFYLIHYFGYPTNGKSQVAEYNEASANFDKEKEELKSAASVDAPIDEKKVIAAGEKLYKEKGCIACHGMQGEGNNIGPNLTDNFWLNGCSEASLIKIITDGKVEKGMTSFKNAMTEAQIKQVSTFILKSLAVSNPPNAKAPQGEECK